MTSCARANSRWVWRIGSKRAWRSCWTWTRAMSDTLRWRKRFKKSKSITWCEITLWASLDATGWERYWDENKNVRSWTWVCITLSVMIINQVNWLEDNVTHVMTRLMFSLQHLLLSHLRLKRIRRINMVWHHTTTWRNAPCPRTHVHVYELRIHSLVVGISHKNLSWFSWEYSYVLIPTCCGHGVIMLCVPLLTDPNQRTQLFIDWGLASVLPLRRALTLW